MEFKGKWGMEVCAQARAHRKCLKGNRKFVRIYPDLY